MKGFIEHYFSAEPHLAAQNEALVNYTRDYFTESGFAADVEKYDIWLNYPVSHRVALLASSGDVEVELSLEEPVLEEDPTTGRENRIPTFHGYSASGNVTGELVYANLGRKADYLRLVEMDVDLRDKVVIVRYGGIFRGLKVKFAEELGAAAVLIYSDPAEDGPITEANGYKAYPDGPARNAEAVQRGSVQDLSHAPGDPTTPGFASTPENDELRTEPQGIPGIPSVPISYADALPLLKSLNGLGPKVPEWEGALAGIDYSIGPSEKKVLVDNAQDYDFRPNSDVIARIQGKSDEEVIIGNHRDAWILGGADPNSGSAVLLEVAHVLGELVKSGWQPERTIVLASWDGEEYGLLGSTEWGEDHGEELKKKAVAYLNCDVGYSGTKFDVSANPLLKNIIEKAAHGIDFQNSTLSKYWGGDVRTRVRPLGSGSDYTVFQDHLGIPSFDVGFAGGNKAVYQYHSNFDSLHWMETFGDTTFEYHEAVTRFILVSALELIESTTISYDLVDYALAVKHDVKRLLDGYEGPAQEEVGRLFHEIGRFIHNSKAYTQKMYSFDHDWDELFRDDDGSFWKGAKKLLFKLLKRKINNNLLDLDKKFLYDEGIEDRPWFKHILYAPGRYTGYAGQVLPGIAESLEDGDTDRLIKWIGITANAVKASSDSLKT